MITEDKPTPEQLIADARRVAENLRSWGAVDSPGSSVHLLVQLADALAESDRLCDYAIKNQEIERERAGLLREQFEQLADRCNEHAHHREWGEKFLDAALDDLKDVQAERDLLRRHVAGFVEYFGAIERRELGPPREMLRTFEKILLDDARAALARVGGVPQPITSLKNLAIPDLTDEEKAAFDLSRPCGEEPWLGADDPKKATCPQCNGGKGEGRVSYCDDHYRRWLGEGGHD